MADSTVIEQLNSMKYLYLREISEPDKKALNTTPETMVQVPNPPLIGHCVGPRINMRPEHRIAFIRLRSLAVTSLPCSHQEPLVAVAPAPYLSDGQFELGRFGLPFCRCGESSVSIANDSRGVPKFRELVHPQRDLGLVRQIAAGTGDRNRVRAALNSAGRYFHVRRT